MSGGLDLNHTRRAFSLVELIVVLTVISLLVALLLPAIQAARESARRAQCQNNVKQIGIAILNYHDTFASFPYGGWGHRWVGVAARGVGKGQPGGWIYSLLPFVEEQDLHDLGRGEDGAMAHDSFSLRLQTPVSLFVCASRRPCMPWPISDKYAYARSPRPFGAVTEVARSDYAINGGSSVVISHEGPTDFSQGDDESYWRIATSARKVSGISHVRFAARLRAIVDGTSKTYLIGEKYVESASYETGECPGDNDSQYAGYCTDLHRFAGAIERLAFPQSPVAAPLDDASTISNGLPGHARFGSAHSEGLNMLACDGSAHFVGFDIDPEVHFRFGHRNDGGATFELLFKAYSR